MIKVVAVPFLGGKCIETVIGKYKTTYELESLTFQKSAKTIDTTTNKTVAESKVLNVAKGVFVVEEKHYDESGKVRYKATLVRSASTGLVIKVLSQEGEMLENYHHFEWVTDGWPVSSGF